VANVDGSELQGTVLVVDDHPLIARMVARLLRLRGIDCQTHLRSFGLLNRIAELKPALVLLDVEMPGIDGPSLTSLIRKDPGLSGCRVVLHSGLPEAELARIASACGADGYLPKGPAMVGLLRMVTHWLRDPSVSRHAASSNG
jgi:two-component system, cell cycle response regulator DivK